MRALRNCDFCDADAVGAFEIVPPELDPTEAEQRRVVLCRDCQGRLESLLEPLIARAGVRTESDTDDPEPVRSAETTTGIAFGDDGETNEDDPGADHSPAADGDETAGLLGSTAESDESDATDAGETASGDGPSSTGDAEPSTESSDRSVESPADADSSASVDSDSAPSADRDSTTRPPQAYAKTIRLLRNREFPMERDDVEELAAGAYDLEPSSAAAIVDHALENDEFTERGGTLHRA